MIVLCARECVVRHLKGTWLVVMWREVGGGEDVFRLEWISV